MRPRPVRLLRVIERTALGSDMGNAGAAIAHGYLQLSKSLGWIRFRI